MRQLVGLLSTSAGLINPIAGFRAPYARAPKKSSRGPLPAFTVEIDDIEINASKTR
jgi:hypothetical protein